MSLDADDRREYEMADRLAVSDDPVEWHDDGPYASLRRLALPQPLDHGCNRVFESAVPTGILIGVASRDARRIETAQVYGTTLGVGRKIATDVLAPAHPVPDPHLPDAPIRRPGAQNELRRKVAFVFVRLFAHAAANVSLETNITLARVTAPR